MEKSEFLTTLSRFSLTTISTCQSTRRGGLFAPAQTGQSVRLVHRLFTSRFCFSSFLNKGLVIRKIKLMWDSGVLTDFVLEYHASAIIQNKPLHLLFN